MWLVPGFAGFPLAAISGARLCRIFKERRHLAGVFLPFVATMRKHLEHGRPGCVGR